MKIPSKIGDVAFTTFILLSLLTMFCGIIWVLTGIWYPTVILLALLTIVIIPITFGTNYHIKDDALYINCGLFLINYKIDYSKIISLTDVDNLHFAPALSYHRISIRFINGETVKSILVSPKDKENFKKLIHLQIDKTMPNNNVVDIDATQSQPLETISAQENNKLLQKLEKRMKSSENAREYQQMQKAVNLANIQLKAREKTAKTQSTLISTDN